MKTIIVISDLLTVLCCLALACTIRYGVLYKFYGPTVLVLLPITIVAFAWQRLYERFMFLNRSETAAGLIKASVSIVVTFVFFHFVTNFKIWEQSRLVIGLYFVFFFIACFFSRIYFYRRLFAFLYKHGVLRKEKVIVYDAHNGHPSSKRSLGLMREVIGYEFVGDFGGDLSDLKKVVTIIEPDKLLLLSQAKTFKGLYEEMQYCMSTEKEFAVVSKLVNNLNMASDVQKLNDASVVWFSNGAKGMVYTGFNSLLKRGMDVFASAIGLIVVSPIMLLISFLVRLTSHGPAVFRQKRFTRNGKPFTFMKFRTMHHGVSHEKHKNYVSNLIKNGNNFHRRKNYKMAADERITPFGNILRKTSLDELPQLINILRGEMSIVGPRPPLEYEVRQYQDWHHDRLKVKQGLTGPWQVYGRSSLPFDAAVFLDLYYVYNQSVFLDLELILRTIPSVLRGKGAA